MTAEGERGRGRPRDTEKDAAIRAATWEVLARLGYGGLTFEAVAEAAGCTRATLYRRFRSKIELLTAVLHGTSQDVEPVTLGAQAPRAALLAVVAGTADYMAGVRGTALLAISSAAARMPEVRAATEAVKVYEREVHWAIYRKLAPAASDARLAFVFDGFIGMMLGHIVLAGTILGPADHARIAETVEAMLLGA